MSEWPKEMFDRGFDLGEGSPGYMVIPADLGRELYEALKGSYEHAPEFTADREEAESALARYEREVGE